MQTKEYRTVDKSSWGPGPWLDEPDKMQWKDEATGLPCLIVRGPAGALCGYVGVAEGHPWHGKSYGDAIGACNEDCDPENGYHSMHRIDSDIDVHGGLTFSDACADTTDESRHICHVPDPGEPDHVWWFGFDCAHYRDFCPGREASSLFNDGDYRDVPYVRGQVQNLARQLATIS
jgi:hypothetical protein